MLHCSAQDVLRCDLCETDPVQFYCELCDVSLCKSCVVNHHRYSSREHKIVPFLQRKSTPNYGKHKGHDISNLSAKTESLLKDVEELEKRIYPRYEEMEHIIKLEKAMLKTNYEKLTTAADQQGKILHREIIAIVKRRKYDIQEMKNKHLSTLDKNTEEITQKITELKQIIADLKSILKSNDVSLTSTYKSRNSEFRSLTPKVRVTLPDFSPGKINKDQLNEMFGSLSSLSINTEHSETMKLPEAVSAPPVKPMMSPGAVSSPVKPMKLQEAVSSPPVKPMKSPEAVSSPVKPMKSPEAVSSPVKPMKSPEAVSSPVKPMKSPEAVSYPPVKSMKSPEAVSSPPVKPMKSAEAVSSPPVKPMKSAEAVSSPPVKPMKSPEAVSSPPVKPLLDDPQFTATTDTGYKQLYGVSCLSEDQVWTSGEVTSLPTREKILRKFKDWLQLQYKDVIIVHAYIGTKMHSQHHEDVFVVVIDDVDVIQHETFEDYGKTFQIVCKLWRYPSSEGVIVSNHGNKCEIPEEKQMQLERCLKRNSNNLFKRHSNLEIISVSAFRSKNNGKELVFDPCIALYCSCKGIAPCSEKEFPREVDGIKTDVREGFFYLFPNDHFFKRSTDLLNPLMVGANIGREGQNKEGTLGGFVTLNNGEIGAITCSHLFFDVNSNSASMTFDVVQPSYGYKNTNEICGRHEKSVSPSHTTQGVTLDVSLIRLTDRIPQRGLFADLKANDLAELGFTHNKLPEYSKGGTRDYRKEQRTRMNACIKCGTGSGLSRGLLRLNGLTARCRDTTFSLTNPPSQAQCTYMSQLEVAGTPQKAFAAAGDSGALVFQVDPPSTEDGDDELVCIGMVVGGTSYYTTVVTPIQPILEALNVKMHVFPQEEMDVS